MVIRCPNKECNTKMSLSMMVMNNPLAKVKCPSCKEFFTPNDLLSDLEKENKSDNKINNKSIEPPIQNEENKPVGWLIVNDEHTHSQSYDLYMGKQIIGKRNQSKPCDIMIEANDPYMSRNHFIIEVLNIGGKYKYLLKDCNSTNNTFVESQVVNNNTRQMRKLREGEVLFIEDGQIIQAGKTKIVLKSLDTVPNKAEATQVVTEQEYIRTIVV